jgi:RimJ/RimL family protein N-acetyltransferase
VSQQQPRLDYACLDGQKIRLRPVAGEDAEPAFGLLHERREIFDWLIWEGPQRASDLLPMYENWAEHTPQGSNYQFALCEVGSDELCGAIGVRFAGHEFQGDVGYWLAVDRWSRGYSSEALGLITWLCFEALAAQLIHASVFLGNDSSVRVLQKCNFRLDPMGKSQIDKGNTQIETNFYGLPRTRWIEAGKQGQPQKSEVRLRTE